MATSHLSMPNEFRATRSTGNLPVLSADAQLAPKQTRADCPRYAPAPRHVMKFARRRTGGVAEARVVSIG